MLVLAGTLFVLETPSKIWFIYILVFAVQLLFISALSSFLAALVPFIPDLTKILSPLMRMTMFLSGIFYHVSLIPEQYVEYFRYNPMAGLIMEYRKVILNSQLPDFVYLGKVSLYSLILLAFGLWILKKFDRMYPRLAKA
jgi:lipopolysaccharide transport system permease protein